VHVFTDGGIQANNPSLITWNEVLQMARLDNPSITEGKSVGCFISIGTGKSKYQIFGRENQNAFSKYLNMNKALRNMLTDTVRSLVTPPLHNCSNSNKVLNYRIRRTKTWKK
jgi:hypothetical protein